MRVPMSWLQQYVEVGATAQEVATRLTMGGLEVEGIEESAIGSVLDAYATPNRGDCLSVVGVAREVAALYGLPLKVPVPHASQSGGAIAGQTSVTVEDAALCPRYAARIVRGIQVGPSPTWMQERLEAAGQRAINNIVDVTNYVMLELGQPLHAFDLHKLAGERIVVRRAGEGEIIKTLDGEERTLNPSILVIADAERPVAVAGVMGGAESEVDAASVDILLESAHFDPLSVRRTSRTLKLRTEASYRFERVVDPNGVQRAIDRACQLLAEMGQPEAVEGLIDVYPQKREPRQLTLRVSRAVDLLGMDITTESATDCLSRLEFTVTSRVDSDAVNVAVPTFRPDIALEEDLVEEVGRIYGYENIPETLPFGVTTQGGESMDGRLIDRIKRSLAALGMQEVVTHSLSAPAFFDSPEDAARRVPVRNVLSAEVSNLRRSLIPTILDVAKHNAAFQQTSMALFEVGRVWQLEMSPIEERSIEERSIEERSIEEGEPGGDFPQPVEYLAVAGLLVGAYDLPGWQNHGKVAPVDFYTARGLVEELVARLGITDLTLTPLAESGSTLLHPGRSATLVRNGAPIGVVGEIHPRLAETLPFRERLYVFEIAFDALRAAVAVEGEGARRARFVSLPRFPAITRDLAPRFPVEVTSGRSETFRIFSAVSDVLVLGRSKSFAISVSIGPG